MGLKAYNGLKIQTRGEYRLQVRNKDIQRTFPFVFVPHGIESIVGDEARAKLGLVKRIQAASKCRESSV